MVQAGGFGLPSVRLTCAKGFIPRPLTHGKLYRMINTTLSVLLGLLSAGATVCGIAYIVVRNRTLGAYRELMAAEGDRIPSARDKYWKLDRRQKRIAIAVLVMYTVIFLILGPLSAPTGAMWLVAMILASLAVLTVGMTASLCNEKETEARIHADSERRFRGLSSPVMPLLGRIPPVRMTTCFPPQLQDEGCSAETGGGALVVAEAEVAPQSLIIIGDFGKDMDDEDTLVLSDGVNRHQVVSTHGSRKQELFEMLAVVANLAPALQRARLAKGTLRLLGHASVPVGVGTDCGLRADGHEKEFEGVAYMAGADELEPGGDLLVRSLESCEDGSAILLLISGLTDAATLLREHAELVRRKTAVVAIMGGVEQKDNVVTLDAEGYMIPDSAANNKFDMDAARFVYRRLQELGIPVTILTREAAYAAPVPRDLYDRMAATGHPVGVKLQKTQRHAIQDVWVRANMAGDDPRRNKLPERCDKQWFCSTFCAGQGLDRNGDDDIWDLIQSFQLYDPMTLIAAIPELAERFFEPVVVTVNGVNHKVIGVSKTVNGVKDPAGLSTYMIECFITSLVANVDSSVG